MAQPEPFPHTTPPDESTPPTLNTSGPVTRHDPDPTLPAPPPLEATGERFEVLRFHAKGGMGEVSVALDRELRREVAYKEIQSRFAADGESRRRFVLEAEVTGRLEHPGIVPIYGLGVQGDGRPYYAMRFIQGDSLRDAIAAFHAADRPGRAPGERELALRGLLRRFVDVCNAVAFAHDRGWLHRDLKPANVMLGKFGETLVVDWGLARPLRTDSGAVRAAESVFPPSSLADSTQETRPGDIVGTPPYMSPEQARGDWEAVGIRSDVYSLGAVLYELLSGKTPFEGTVSEVLEAVKSGRLVPVRQRTAGVPAALAAVVSKAMALRREERCATAQDLAAEVERWLADEPVTAYREPLSQRVRRWGRRHRALVTGLGVLLLTTSVALTVGLVLVNEARATATAAKQATAEALQRERREKQDKEAALARVTEEEGKTRLALGAATQQRQLALGTIRKVVDKIHEKLKNRPDLHELREELLEQARAGLDAVSRAADTAKAIDHTQIRVHFELGDLYLLMEKRGVEPALQQYQRGHAIARRLAEANPQNAAAQRDLAVSHNNLGGVQLQLGDTKAALEAYQQFHALARRLAEADPKNAVAQRDLAGSHNNLGNVRLRLGETQAALDAYQQCHEVFRRLAQAEPKNVVAQRDLSLSLNNLGDVQLRLGDTKAALDAYQQSHNRRCQLAESDPKNAEAQRDLAASHNNLGDVCLRLGDTKAALGHYQQALDVSKRLAKADPGNAQIQRSLAFSHLKLGSVLVKLLNMKAALEHYQQYSDISFRLAEADPKNVEAQRDLAGSLDRLGGVRLTLGDTTAALGHYQQAFAIFQRLAEADPKNAQAQRDLAGSLDRLGGVRLTLGDTTAALGHYQQAIAICQRLAEADPGNAEALSHLALSHIQRGDVRQQVGELKAALQDYQQALLINRRLAEADPRNAEAQLHMSLSHERLGDVRLKLEEPKTALEHYQRYHEINQRRCMADPNNARTQRSLAGSSIKLGDVRLKLDDAQAALDAYQLALDLHRRLAEADPKNAVAQRDLSVSYNKLGEVRLKMGNTMAARDAFQQVLEVRQRLAEADPGNVQTQRDLLISCYKFGELEKAQHGYARAASWYEKALEIPRRSPQPGFFKTDVAVLESRLRLCRAAGTVLADPASAKNLDVALRIRVLSTILAPLAKEKQRDKLLFVGDLLTKEVKNPVALYQATCAFSLCIPLTDQADDKEKHARRAVALLQQAIAVGYKDRAHMEKDTNLDPLRQRADFQKVLQSLPAKPAP